MTHETATLDQTVVATQVCELDRLGTLPRHFGRAHLTLEHAIYTFMRSLSKEYTGGLWQFFNLSNGGFYMTPETPPLRVEVFGNHFEGRLSPDAAGIVACLFAYSHLSFRDDGETFADYYHRLREFALEHAEAGLIFAAID